MRQFTDAKGGSWGLTLNLGTAMAVKDKLGVDLLQPESGDPPLITRLGTDEMLLGEVLCAMLDDQFEARGLTGKEVRALFDGKALLAAQTAFYDELVDFFQSRGRTDRAKAVAKQREMIDAAVRAVGDRIDGIDTQKTIDGAMSGVLPVRSGSDPATSGA